MPLQDHMKLISVDDHLLEHPRVWTDRIPSKYLAQAPHMVEDDWLQYWVYEETAVVAYMGLQGASGRPVEEYSKRGIHLRDVLPGALDPRQRLHDMDIDGVWAQLCFPTYPRFSGTRFLAGKDKVLAHLCVQAYNDFVLDEWCATAPDRYIPLVILPLWNPALAVAEIERTAAKGTRSIAFPENPVPLGLPSFHGDHWDPVFAAAQDAELPLSIHIGTSGKRPIPSEESPEAVYVALMGTNSMMTMADLLLSPVFHKFPRLRVALSEGGIGWIPYLKERLDWTWERQRHWNEINGDVPPSELFDRHIHGCFVDEEAGLVLRHRIGIGNIMWESDYPHSDSSWPHSRERAKELLADVPDDEAHRMVELNARRLYRFGQPS